MLSATRVQLIETRSSMTNPFSDGSTSRCVRSWT